jgi:hypothetical protein
VSVYDQIIFIEGLRRERDEAVAERDLLVEENAALIVVYNEKVGEAERLREALVNLIDASALFDRCIPSDSDEMNYRRWQRVIADAHSIASERMTSPLRNPIREALILLTAERGIVKGSTNGGVETLDGHDYAAIEKAVVGDSIRLTRRDDGGWIAEHPRYGRVGGGTLDSVMRTVRTWADTPTSALPKEHKDSADA